MDKGFRHPSPPAGCGLSATRHAPRPRAGPARRDPRQASPKLAPTAGKLAPAPGKLAPARPRPRALARPGSTPRRARRTAAQIHAQRARATRYTRDDPPPPRAARSHAGPRTTTFQICSSFFYVSYIWLVICVCVGRVLVVFVGVFWYCVWVAFKPDLKPIKTIKRPKGGKRGC